MGGQPEDIGVGGHGGVVAGGVQRARVLPAVRLDMGIGENQGRPAPMRRAGLVPQCPLRGLVFVEIPLHRKCAVVEGVEACR